MISQDGTPIAFVQVGAGPALIVVTGALGDHSGDAPLAALLAPHFTVFSYDRRGRGASGDTPPYAVEREVEDLKALIVAAGGSAFVLGGSSGAVLALEAAARGLAIPRLALYEPPFIVDGTRPPLPANYVARVRDLVADGRRGEAVEYFMTAAVGIPPEVMPQVRSAPMWPALEAAAHTLAYDGMLMGDHMGGHPLPVEQWATVTMPVLAMDGGASPLWARNAVQALVHVLPNARRRTLEGQTHVVTPEALAPVLIEFFVGTSG